MNEDLKRLLVGLTIILGACAIGTVVFFSIIGLESLTHKYHWFGFVLLSIAGLMISWFIGLLVEGSWY